MSSIQSSGSSLAQVLASSQRGRVDADGDHDGDRSARLQKHINAALTSIGVDSSKIGDIDSQIQTALQALPAPTAGGKPGDQRDSVRAAIDGVLQKNGVDVQQFRKALQAQHNGGHHRHARQESSDQQPAQAGQSLLQPASGVDVSA